MVLAHATSCANSGGAFLELTIDRWLGLGEHRCDAAGRWTGDSDEHDNLERMVTPAERAAERRLERLAAMQRQVKDGSLKIRKMTPEERKRYPRRPSTGRRK
jgi:hypothetical protein